MCVYVCMYICMCVMSWSEELNFAVLHTAFVTSQPRIVRMRQGNHGTETGKALSNMMLCTLIEFYCRF